MRKIVLAVFVSILTCLYALVAFVTWESAWWISLSLLFLTLVVSTLVPKGGKGNKSLLKREWQDIFSEREETLRQQFQEARDDVVAYERASKDPALSKEERKKKAQKATRAREERIGLRVRLLELEEMRKLFDRQGLTIYGSSLVKGEKNATIEIESVVDFLSDGVDQGLPPPPP